MSDTTAQQWSTLPTALQDLVTTRLRKQADDCLAAGRAHARAAKGKQSTSAHKKEAARAQLKLQEATALLAAWRLLTGTEAEESRIVLAR